MFDRCPSLGDIGEVWGMDAWQVSQFWGHRAGGEGHQAGGKGYGAVDGGL